MQFNPGKVKAAKISAFKLEKKNKNGRWTLIKAVRELNHKSDPHKSFSQLQFAWFPLQRLDWGSSYRASVSVDIEGKKNRAKRNISWQFRTKVIDTPLITVKSSQQKVAVPKDQWFTLYLLPSKTVSRPMKNIKLGWRGKAKVTSKVIDMNTVKLKLQNIKCEPVTLKMAQGRTLLLKTCDG